MADTLFPTQTPIVTADKSITGASLIAQAIRDLGVPGLVTADQIGQILYGRTAAEIAAGVTPTSYAYQEGDPLRYGCALDGATDDTAALAKWWSVAKQGVEVFGRPGTSLTSSPLETTAPLNAVGNGMRIKLTASAAHVILFDYSGSDDEAWDYGGKFTGFVLDGNGNATYGLAVTAAINGDFSGNQVTNVTTTGVYARFAQLCKFDYTIVSNNYETFTTTPVNGIHFDEGPGTITSSSANSIEKCTIEHVSGVGILGQWLVNSRICGGTSEGNDKGIVIGHATSGSGIANVIGGGIDLEANTTTDIELLATAYANYIDGAAAGFESPAILVSGSNNNHFNAGTCGGITFNASANHNTVDGVTIVGTGRTITDAGSGNSWRGVFNITDGTVIGDNPVRRRANFSLADAATATIDAKITSNAVITAGGATLTIAAPTDPTDGQELDITVHNASGGAITTTWNAAFKKSAWTEPATGNNRSARYRYDANYGAWYLQSQSAADVPN